MIRELEIEQIKDQKQKIRNRKNNESEELHVELRFGTMRYSFWEKPNSIEEEIELKKITRKNINEIDRLEAKIKEMEELKIEGESKATKFNQI